MEHTVIGEILPRIDQMSQSERQAELAFIRDLEAVIADQDRIIGDLKSGGPTMRAVAENLVEVRDRIARYAAPFIGRGPALIEAVEQSARKKWRGCGCGSAAGVSKCRR